MIKVDDKNVEIRGKLLEIINDLINVMKVIREGASPENDERRIDELFTIAIEFSKKNSEEITPEYEKTVCEIVRERLSKAIKEEEIVNWPDKPVDTKVWKNAKPEDENGPNNI